MAIPTLSRAGRKPFEIEQGATFDPYIHWADEFGAGIDLTAVTEIRMQVRDSADAASVLLELTVTNGKIINVLAGVVLGPTRNNYLEVATITTAGVVVVDPIMLGQVDFVTAGVQVGDVVNFPGTLYDAGADGLGHLVTSVDSALQITVDPVSRQGFGGTTLLNESTGDGQVIASRLGQFQLMLTAAETAALTWETGVYDIEIVDGATVVRLLQGSIRVSPEVTK